MNPVDEMATKHDAAGTDEKSDQQLHTILENLGRVAHQDELHSGFTPRLDLEALERKAIYDRLVAIENQMKRRGSGGFTRYLVGILIGVAATFAWQSWTKPLATLLFGRPRWRRRKPQRLRRLLRSQSRQKRPPPPPSTRSKCSS